MLGLANAGFQKRVSVVFRGFPWFSVAFPWFSVVFHVFSAIFRGFPWFSVDFRGLPSYSTLQLLSLHRGSLVVVRGFPCFPLFSVVVRGFLWFPRGFPWFSVAFLWFSICEPV